MYDAHVISQWIRHGTGFGVFLAEADDMPVGFVQAKVCALGDGVMLGSLDHLYVVPALRRVGVGHKLLAHSEAFMVARGAVEAALTVVTRNRPAKRFYAQAGWLPGRPKTLPPQLGVRHCLGLETMYKGLSHA